ncbi:MAG: NADH-quinone oxidoreductase subunit C [Bacillota bacterium]
MNKYTINDGFFSEEAITLDFINSMQNKISGIKRKNRRIYFEVTNEHLLEVAGYLFNEMHCRLSTATAMETYYGLEILYHFSFDPAGCYYCPRLILTDKNNPSVNSISKIIKGAEWIEREISELWGITFVGHPRLEPLLTGNHPNNLKMPLRFRRVK